MHDIVGENHPESHKALIRIEDINPTSDPDELRKIVKYLHENNIPFSVGFVPVYIDPQNRTEYHLDDYPKLWAFLKQIPSMGGSFVLHGYTHQYRGVTTDDYEFWDEVLDKPVRKDSVEYASNRIEKSLKECFADGIYPLVWETPHYCASKNDYVAIRKYFSVCYDRRNVMDALGTDQYYPYDLTDQYGQRVIPENLGYVDVSSPDARPIIEGARLNLKVRDGYASFFYHPFVDLSYLKEIVKSFKDMNYTFVSIKSFFPKVVAKDKAVLTKDDRLKIFTKDRYISTELFNSGGRSISSKIFPAALGKPFDLDVRCPPNDYAVVKTEDELEPSSLQKIWHLAKKDLAILTGKSRKDIGTRPLRILRVALVVPPPASRLQKSEKNDFESFKFSLSVAGVKYSEITAADLVARDYRDFHLVIIPYAAASRLSAKETQIMKDMVNSGVGVVLDKESELSDAMNINLYEETIKVKKLTDYQFTENPIFWPVAEEVNPINSPEGNEYKILYGDSATTLPLVVSAKFGNGTFLFFSTYFDQYTNRGYSKYPYFIEMLSNVFDYKQYIERKNHQNVF